MGNDDVMSVERYVGIKTDLATLQQQLANIEKSNNKGFEAIDKRFEQIVKSNEAKDKKLENALKLAGDLKFQVEDLIEDQPDNQLNTKFRERLENYWKLFVFLFGSNVLITVYQFLKTIGVV